MMRLLHARRADGIRVDIFDSRRLGALKSHGKILLIDGRVAVVGSLAFAPMSLDFRREVALAVDEPLAVAEVARLFRTIAALPPSRSGRTRQLNAIYPAPLAMASAAEEASC
jgi:phosphatidylserine/phosphatidylglycerophosphate/cardiolipin synthase-like enzyme